MSSHRVSLSFFDLCPLFSQSNNKISTPLPTELSHLSNLKRIELENNEIPIIPDYFGIAFPDLDVLQLSDNGFRGMVPGKREKSGGMCSVILVQWQYLNMSY